MIFIGSTWHRVSDGRREAAPAPSHPFSGSRQTVEKTPRRQIGEFFPDSSARLRWLSFSPEKQRKFAKTTAHMNHEIGTNGGAERSGKRGVQCRGIRRSVWEEKWIFGAGCASIAKHAGNADGNENVAAVIQKRGA